MKGPNDFDSDMTEAERQKVKKLCAEIESHAEQGGRWPVYFDADQETPMRVLRAVLQEALAAGWDAEIKSRTLVRDALFINGPAR